jgi:hypothetical protein
MPGFAGLLKLRFSTPRYVWKMLLDRMEKKT